METAVRPISRNPGKSTAVHCRFCRAPLETVFVDLGMSPLANSYRTSDQLQQMEPFYPLRVYVCDRCLLVQLPEFESPAEIFGHYAYFSSFSTSWLDHARRYAEMAIERFHLSSSSQVIEVASNDGYLLQYFQARGIPVYGIEPAANVAQVAREKDIPTLVRFFGTETARDLVAEGLQADLLIGNNVLAHVPDLNDFVAGLKLVLKRNGVVSMEFPHLMRLMQENQFDTIYHEHYSYFSLCTAEAIFKAHGLKLFDVEELPTHGGSLRIFACHREDSSRPASSRVAALKRTEKEFGLTNAASYRGFSDQVQRTKRRLLQFLIGTKEAGRSVAGYGAPAKANTLLNYCGIREDLLEYTVDLSPHKQGRYLPGTRIPIYPPEKIRETKPDYILILPWNLREEIMQQLGYVAAWGARFVVPIPEVQVLEGRDGRNGMQWNISSSRDLRV